MTRSQFIHTFDLKQDAHVEKLVQQALDDGCKRLYIDLGIHLKQMLIQSIALLVEEKDETWQKIEVTMPHESHGYGTMPSVGTVNLESQNTNNTVS